MNGFSLKKGLDFDRSGTAFRIDRLQPNGDALIERVDDGQLTIVTCDLLLLEYTQGQITAPTVGPANPARKEQFSRPIDELSEPVQAEATRRWHYIKAILESRPVAMTEKLLNELIETVAVRIHDSNPPSRPTVHRWFARYRICMDARALIPRIDLRGPSKLRQGDKILQYAAEATDEAFKASPLANVPGIYVRLIAKIDEHNRRTPPVDHLKRPSLRTTYRMIRRLDAYDLALLREGKRLADNRFRIAKAGLRMANILERIEVDHSPLDLFLIDDLTWLPLGRPTLTVAIDHFSRMPLGYYLSFGSPSVSAVMGTLRHAILPKQKITETLPNLKVHHPWPCYGVPDLLALDNGLEFLGQALESVAFELGSLLIFCPKKQPWFKGVIERYLKTINYFFAHQLPGASYARLHLRGDYDPQKHALLTLAEFKHVFEKWVVDVYAQSIHKGIGTTPWAKWHEGLARRQPNLPGDVRTLQQRIGHVTERSLRRDGIHLNSMLYNGDAVNSILCAYGEGVKVRVVFDSEDLGEIQIWGPDEQNPVSVPAVDYAYANGLTKLQNELIQTQLREQGRAAEDPETLQQAKHELAMAVQQLMQSRKQGHRRKAAAIRGMSSNNPQADLLKQTIVSTTPQKKKPKPQSSVIDPMPAPAYATFQLKKLGDST